MIEINEISEFNSEGGFECIFTNLYQGDRRISYRVGDEVMFVVTSPNKVTCVDLGDREVIGETNAESDAGFMCDGNRLYFWSSNDDKLKFIDKEGKINEIPGRVSFGPSNISDNLVFTYASLQGEDFVSVEELGNPRNTIFSQEILNELHDSRLVHLDDKPYLIYIEAAKVTIIDVETKERIKKFTKKQLLKGDLKSYNFYRVSEGIPYIICNDYKAKRSVLFSLNNLMKGIFEPVLSVPHDWSIYIRKITKDYVYFQTYIEDPETHNNCTRLYRFRLPCGAKSARSIQ